MPHCSCRRCCCVAPTRSAATPRHLRRTACPQVAAWMAISVGLAEASGFARAVEDLPSSAAAPPVGAKSYKAGVHVADPCGGLGERPDNASWSGCGQLTNHSHPAGMLGRLRCKRNPSISCVTNTVSVPGLIAKPTSDFCYLLPALGKTCFSSLCNNCNFTANAPANEQWPVGHAWRQATKYFNRHAHPRFFLCSA